MITRAVSGLAGVVLLALTFGGAIAAVIVVGRAAWGWLFLVIPAAFVVVVILARLGTRLLIRALDG